MVDGVVVLPHSTEASSIAPMLAVTKNAALITNAVAAPESVSPFKVKRKAFSGKAFMMAEASGNQVIITVSQNSFELKKIQFQEPKKRKKFLFLPMELQW